MVLERIATLQDKMGKVLEVEFRGQVDPPRFEMRGVSTLESEGRTIKLLVTENLDSVIKALADHEIVNMSLSTYSLEQLFLRYYGGSVRSSSEDSS